MIGNDVKHSLWSRNNPGLTLIAQLSCPHLSHFIPKCWIKEAVIFQIISAQQLPKPEWDKPSSIVDPQVWVEIYGVPIDNMKKKTTHIENNGKCLLF